MSNSQSASANTKHIRHTIRSTAERHETATVREVVTETADICGCAEAAVVNELDRLERNGLVYLVPGDGCPDDQEVRVP